MGRAYYNGEEDDADADRARAARKAQREANFERLRKYEQNSTADTEPSKDYQGEGKKPGLAKVLRSVRAVLGCA
ncbi:hypothetical protein AMS68_004406 [Peltaster fructicola]|uniref:Uncharacterized protein n=1 Tax=Peltaster fructicola TaxID=286661 RepID=A0A6H0XW97_9PEZI|nr:hypothetical protein AMS68_004406 [Peltaster fructicola]